MPLTPEQLQRILNAQEWDPFSVLGPHRECHGKTDHIRIRAFLPDAAEVACLPYDQHTDPLPMTLVAPDGLFGLGNISNVDADQKQNQECSSGLCETGFFTLR